MIRLIYLLFGIFFSSIALASPQGKAQAVFENFLSDFTAGNSDAVAAHFTPDALFWGTASRDLVAGSDSIRAYFSGVFKRLPGAKATAIGDVSALMISENVMAVSGLWQIERMVDGKLLTTELRNSITLVQRDGKWLIASFANSPRPAAP